MIPVVTASEVGKAQTLNPMIASFLRGLSGTCGVEGLSIGSISLGKMCGNTYQSR